MQPERITLSQLQVPADRARFSGPAAPGASVSLLRLGAASGPPVVGADARAPFAEVDVTSERTSVVRQQ